MRAMTTVNPYAAPQSPTERPVLPGQAGRIDIGAAYGEGWRLCRRYFWSWLIATFIVGVLSILSVIALIIPFLIVGPALYWGLTRYLLDGLEERAEVNAVFSGFQQLGTAVSGFLVFVGFSMLVSIPGSVMSNAGELMENPILGFVGSIVSAVVGFLSFRWSFAPFFIVDRGLGGWEAVQASWVATRGQWVTIIMFMLVSLPVMLLGLVALVVGVFPAAATVTFAWTAAYRQLVGPHAGASSP